MNPCLPPPEGVGGVRALLPARYVSSEELWFQLEQQKKMSQTRKVATTRSRTQRSRATAGSVGAQETNRSMLRPGGDLLETCWRPAGASERARDQFLSVTAAPVLSVPTAAAGFQLFQQRPGSDLSSRQLSMFEGFTESWNPASVVGVAPARSSDSHSPEESCPGSGDGPTQKCT